jgi:hypothetical protein
MRRRRCCGGSFDLERDDPSRGELREQIDLVPSVLLAQVVERRRRRREFELWSDLCGDEVSRSLPMRSPSRIAVAVSSLSAAAASEWSTR